MLKARERVARYLFHSTDPKRTGLRWWDVSELAIVAFAFLCYFLVRGAVVDRADEALAHARWIVDLQLALGVFVELDIQRLALEHELLRRLFNFAYFWLDFPLIAVVGLLLFWKRRHAYTLTRDAILISGGIALVIYWLFPVAPPRFLTEWGFVDTLEVYDNLSYQAQSMQPFVNPYAAVPSLHVGWSALLVVGAVVATTSLWWRAGAFVVFVLQSVSVVGTGNHFVFDGVVGLLVCAVALAAAIWMQRVGYPMLRRQLAAWAGTPVGAGAAERRPARAGGG